MAIKAVVFDIGGVLECTPSHGIPQKWEARLGLPDGEINRRMKTLWIAGSIGNMTEAEIYAQVPSLTGMTPAQLEEYWDDLWREYVGTLNVELTDYFRGLSSRFKTAIISNSFVGAREREEALYRFSELTNLIIYSHEAGVTKPDSRIFEIACEHLNIRPHEMIFVDDVLTNIDAARALGIHGILFTENAQAIAAIEACIRVEAAK